MSTQSPRLTKIRDEYIHQTLWKDLGISSNDITDLSWYLQDFTNSGDNFTCDVTSIQVRWSQKNVKKHKSYVVKMARPITDLEIFQEVIERANIKEAKVLLDVIPELNDCLARKGIETLKVPKAYFCHADPNSYVLIMEDLREKEFQLFNRKKGMDWNHAVLVIKELAKIHAASKVLERHSSSPIDKLFPDIKEPFKDFLEADNHPFLRYYQNFVRTHVGGAISILKNTGGHDTSVRWLEKYVNNGGETILKLLQPSGSIYCLNHGDCWNNNIMFRYNSEGAPVDVRLVDFQGARKASPACDISYFSYLSLSGKTRSCDMSELLHLYYKEFSEICSISKIKISFSFKELQEEMSDKKPLGILFGINRLPLLMADEDNVPALSDLFKEECQQKRCSQIQALNNNEAYRERFLSLFDGLL